MPKIPATPSVMAVCMPKARETVALYVDFCNQHNIDWREALNVFGCAVSELYATAMFKDDSISIVEVDDMCDVIAENAASVVEEIAAKRMRA